MKNAIYQCKFKINESTLTQYSVGESAAATLTSLRVSVPGCKCVRVSVREHNTHTSVHLTKIQYTYAVQLRD